MIEQIILTNFRKFEKFSLRLKATNILVGPNNSGKSSILDALRLFDSCLRSVRNQTPIFFAAPGEGVVRGYHIGENSLPFNLANVTRDYSDQDACVEVVLSNKSRAVMRLHPNRVTKF